MSAPCSGDITEHSNALGVQQGGGNELAFGVDVGIDFVDKPKEMSRDTM